MAFVFDIRASDAPFVEGVWRTTSEEGGSFMSVAGTQWQMVFTKQLGKTILTIRGPETKASIANIPEYADFFGINFIHGSFMPRLPTDELVDLGLDLHEVNQNRFWLHGSTWEFPTFENADSFVQRLVSEELLVFDSVVMATLQNQSQDLSLRTVQRRFLRATGLTHGAFSQIERAKEAVALLESGASILDTVELVGYADQPHLTRSLKRFVGRTPAEILRDYWSK